LDLLVRPGVFIPRPETEILVETALELLAGVHGPAVVDVGTGTGAVALTIAQERADARVFATELSAEAVALAREDAVRLGADVTVLEGDLLAPLGLELAGWVALVISNPPYVDESEASSLAPEVRADPALALFGGTDVHRRLAVESLPWLRPGGALAVE